MVGECGQVMSKVEGKRGVIIGNGLRIRRCTVV